MFQLEDEDFDLNEEFLDEIFQLSDPRKAGDDGDSNRKTSKTSEIKTPILNIPEEKKDKIIEGNTHLQLSSSYSPPLAKKARYACDADQRLVTEERSILELRGDRSLSSSIIGNSGFLPKDPCLDIVNNGNIEKNIFGQVNEIPMESFMVSTKCFTNRAESFKQQSFSNSVKRRKFPGPAGLLPELDKRKCYPDLSQLPLESVERKKSFSNNNSQEGPEITLSQPCAVSSLFGSNSPWESLRQQMGLDSTDSQKNPLSRICLKWAKQKASSRQLPGHKVPFLAVAIHALDYSSPDPCVILRDPTGEMGGTLHREVWEKYGYLLHPGAAMALRQVGVLSTGAAARRHYLTITENNLLSIYSSSQAENGQCSLAKRKEASNSDIVITKIRSLDMNEVKRSLTEMQNISQNPISPNAVQSPPSLYSTVSSGHYFSSSLGNSVRSVPYRTPNSSNFNRFPPQCPQNSASGQNFSPRFRSPNSLSPGNKSPMQSCSSGASSTAVLMDVQHHNSPVSSRNPSSSPFTHKLPLAPVGSFIPKQPFLNKVQAQNFGSPSVPLPSERDNTLFLGRSVGNQNATTAMEVTISPCVSETEQLSNSGNIFERKETTITSGAVGIKNQNIAETELDSILGGINTDLLFDDDDDF